MTERRYRALVLSVVKHDYIATAVDAHPRFDLVAVCDDADQPDWVHARNQAFATRHHLAYLHDLKQAIRDYCPDLAVVSSQAERHCELAVRAAESGLHVVVDKPLSTILSECDRLVASVETAGVRCLVWNRNFLPALQQAHAVIQSGALGSLRAVHCDFYFAKDAGPPKVSEQPRSPRINWLERQIEAHFDGSDGGVGVEPMGELQVEGIYPLAYLRMLTGCRVERVFARTASHFHQAHVDNGVDDLATVTLEMEGGIVGSLCLGRIGAASHPDLGEIKLHVLGSDGSLVISESRPEVAIHYRGQPSAEFPHVRVADESDFLLMDHFAKAMDDGSSVLLDAQAGRDICAIVNACLKSGRTSRLESVDYPSSSPEGP